MARRRRHNNALRWIETGPRAAEPLTGGSAAARSAAVPAGSRRAGAAAISVHVIIMNMYPYSKPHGNRADERFWFCPAPITGARAARAPLHLEGAAGDPPSASGTWLLGSWVPRGSSSRPCSAAAGGLGARGS